MTKRDFEKEGILDFFVNRLFIVTDKGVSEVHVADVENFNVFTNMNPFFDFCYFIIRASVVTNGNEIEEKIRYLVRYPHGEVGDHIVDSIIQRECEIYQNKIKTSVSASLSPDESKAYTTNKFLKFNDYTYIPSKISAFSIEVIFDRRSRDFEEIKRLVS